MPLDSVLVNEKKPVHYRTPVTRSVQSRQTPMQKAGRQLSGAGRSLGATGGQLTGAARWKHPQTVVEMVAKLFRNIHLKWVNHKACKLYLNKAITKNKKTLKWNKSSYITFTWSFLQITEGPRLKTLITTYCIQSIFNKRWEQKNLRQSSNGICISIRPGPPPGPARYLHLLLDACRGPGSKGPPRPPP